MKLLRVENHYYLLDKEPLEESGLYCNLMTREIAPVKPLMAKIDPLSEVNLYRVVASTDPKPWNLHLLDWSNIESVLHKFSIKHLRQAFNEGARSVDKDLRIFNTFDDYLAHLRRIIYEQQVYDVEVKPVNWGKTVQGAYIKVLSMSTEN